MRHFTLPPDHLAVLERALGGQLSHAVAQITQAGGDPQLHAERIQPGGNGTSEWNLLVVGAGQVHRLPVGRGIGFPEGEVDVTVLQAEDDAVEEQAESRPRRLSVDQLLAARLKPLPGVGPVSLADIERTIAHNATGQTSGA